MKYSVSQKQIEQRTLRTKDGRTNLFRTFRPAAFVAALFVFIGMVASQGNAQTDGIMVLQNMTTPRGGVWLKTLPRLRRRAATSGKRTACWEFVVSIPFRAAILRGS